MDTRPSTRSLTSLSTEIFQIIVMELDLLSIACLSRASKGMMSSVATSSPIARMILKDKALFSKEAMGARNEPVAALQRLLKRVEAYTNRLPFSAAVIGCFDEHLYSQGVICGRIGDQIRLFDVQSSALRARVVDSSAVLKSQRIEAQNDQLRILHYSDDILSFLNGCWLIAVNTLTEEVIMSEEVALTPGIFVRNNANYLYYGIHSEQRGWVVTGYCIEAREKLDEVSFARTSMEIGTHICFEIFDDHFYIVATNEADIARDIVRDDWQSSFYHWRFPVERPVLGNTRAQTIWRRDHHDGPILRSSLRLSRSEVTGEIQIVETRSEMPPGIASRCWDSSYIYPLADSGSSGSCPDVHHVYGGDELSVRSSFLHYLPLANTLLDIVRIGSGLQLRLRPALDRRVREPSVATSVLPLIPCSNTSHSYRDPWDGILEPGEGGKLTKGTVDDRSVVYAVDMRNGTHTVGFISFDPTIKLAEAEKWPPITTSTNVPSGGGRRGVGDNRDNTRRNSNWLWLEPAKYSKALDFGL